MRSENVQLDSVSDAELETLIEAALVMEAEIAQAVAATYQRCMDIAQQIGDARTAQAIRADALRVRCH